MQNCSDALGHLDVIVGGPVAAIGQAGGLVWVVLALAEQMASQCLQAMQYSSLVGIGAPLGSMGLAGPSQMGRCWWMVPG